MCLGGPGRWEKWVRVRPPCSAMDRWPGGERGQVPGAAGTGAGEDGAQAPSQGSEVITVPWGTREHAHAQCTHTCTCGEQTLAGFRAVRPGPGHPTGRPLPGRGPSGGAGGVPEVSAPWRGSWVPPPPPQTRSRFSQSLSARPQPPAPGGNKAPFSRSLYGPAVGFLPL